MWYSEEHQTRGNTVTFPDQTKITAEDAVDSPVRGWEWHPEPPQWFLDAQEQSNGIE